MEYPSPDPETVEETPRKSGPRVFAEAFDVDSSGDEKKSDSIAKRTTMDL